MAAFCVRATSSAESSLIQPVQQRSDVTLHTPDIFIWNAAKSQKNVVDTVSGRCVLVMSVICRRPAFGVRHHDLSSAAHNVERQDLVLV